MKRKQEAELQRQEDLEKRKKLLAMTEWKTDEENSLRQLDISGSNLKHKLQCTYETEDLFCSLPGRRSFKGFNIIVERQYDSIMSEQRAEKLTKEAIKDTISDEEMVARYENMRALPRGPNMGRKETRNNKKDRKKK